VPVQPIQIKRGDRRSQFKSVLSYGRSRSGKTRFAATFPRPRFLSDASERGWNTIETMPSEEYYEPDWIPQVYPVEDAGQMAEVLALTKEAVYKGEILTVVIDSLTFYADAFYSEIHRRAVQTSGSKAIDTRALFGALAQHLANLRIDIHKWPCNVVWLALEKPPGEDNPVGGPLLTGQTAQKFPAGCDHVFFHRSFSSNATIDGKLEQVRTFEMRTAPFGQYVAGGRDSGMLPDPIINPTYRVFAEYLELGDPLAARKPTPSPTPATAPAPVAGRRVVTATSTPARRS
jgi:hypothetical protein